MLKKKEILGAEITDATQEEIVEYFFALLQKDDKHYIVTPNPELVVYAQRHPQFKTILNNASISLCDGIGLYWAAKFLGKPLKERTTGTDFMELVCRESVKQDINIGLLGGKRGVAERTAEQLRRRHPGVDIVFVAEEWPDKIENGELRIEKSDTSKKLSTLNSQLSTIDILFVAFGHPKQEEWISKHITNLPVKAAMGVGGAFDYISGSVLRAPLLMRKLGLEWLFRLVRQPWRLKRIGKVALLEFVLLTIREKFLVKQ